MTRVLIAVLALLTTLAGAQPEAPPTEAPPPPLGITIGANGTMEPTLSPGAPLTFTVEMENAAAADALAAASAANAARASLAGAVADGRMTKLKAEATAKSLPAPPPVAPPLTIAPLAARFTWLLADGSPAPWSPRMVTPDNPAMTLNGQQTLTATFVVPPEATRATPPGQYRLHLRYNSAGAPAGEWAGVADSDEVTITLVAPPANPTARQQFDGAYALSMYHLATGDFAAAAADAAAMQAAQPDSVLARYQLGSAREGLKDLTAALAAYRDALHQYLQLYPKGEPPFTLIEAVHRCAALLAPKPPAPNQ